MNGMKVALLKYEGGNTASVRYALRRLGVEPELTADAEVICRADKVIFPGVGHAQACRASLEATGLWALLPTLQQPVLGICVGLQLLCQRSEEGPTKGLGVFEAAVSKFPPAAGHKVPHMGWNAVAHQDHPLFAGIPSGTPFYFVHSYRAGLHPTQTVGKTDYVGSFSAAFAQASYYGVQFHPEKSGPAGAQLLKNFLDL